VLLLFVPTSLVLTLLLFLSFIVVGLVGYYLKLHQAAWIPYALCLFLWIKLPIDSLHMQRQSSASTRNPLFIHAIVAFMAIATVSTIANDTPFITALVGAKNYLFIWSVALLLSSGVVSEGYLRVAWLGSLAVAVIQAPFAALQHYIQFRSRGNWDAVVGTFGGNPEGGGGSGSMAIFVCAMVGITVALVRVRQIPLWAAGIVLAASGISLLMAEVKIVFVLLPLVLGIVMLREVGTRPLVVVAALAVAALFLLGEFVYYKSTYSTGSGEAQALDTRNYLDYALKADASPDFVNRFTGEVSRLGAPLVWFRHADEWGPDKPLIGYGMAATRASQTIGLGVAQRRFSFTLSTSSLTVLLWETGWLGSSAILGALLLCAIAAWRLSSRASIPSFHRAVLEGCTGALAVAIATIPYNVAFVDGPALQIFYAFIVGYVLYWHRRFAAESGVLTSGPR
jgi:uncharacterized membrane protein SirB2